MRRRSNWRRPVAFVIVHAELDLNLFDLGSLLLSCASVVGLTLDSLKAALVVAGSLVISGDRSHASCEELL